MSSWQLQISDKQTRNDMHFQILHRDRRDNHRYSCDRDASSENYIPSSILNEELVLVVYQHSSIWVVVLCLCLSVFIKAERDEACLISWEREFHARTDDGKKEL